ncbi:MAG: hypothetical protein AAB500_02480 [Patescibacteria group bacterium]
MKKFAVKILLAILALTPGAPLSATDVINNVSASASTGGNSAGPADSMGSPQGGTVIEGEGQAQVKIYTEINGEVITDIDETVVAPLGEDAVIKKEIESVIEETEVAEAESIEIEMEMEKGKGSRILAFFAFFGKIFKYVFSIF